LKHEVPGKARQVALDGLHQDSSFDLIERRKVVVEEDFVAARDENCARDLRCRNRGGFDHAAWIAASGVDGDTRNWIGNRNAFQSANRLIKSRARFRSFVFP
jgi:hypothetical protein